ncbi:MAG: hypothetical protein ACOC3Z_02060 [Nanoarchaeota archaeon]
MSFTILYILLRKNNYDEMYKIQIDGNVFNKKELKTKVRKIKNSYPKQIQFIHKKNDIEFLNKLYGNDGFYWIVEREEGNQHLRKYYYKTNDDIFSIFNPDNYLTHEFQEKLIDRFGIDDNIDKITNRNNTIRNIKATLRSIINPEIEKFRNILKPRKCRITGELIEVKDFDIHHKEPYTFNQIVKDWLRDIIKNNDYKKSLNKLNDNIISIGKKDYKFKNEKLNESFIKYHNNKCELIGLSKDEHKKIHFGKK